MDWYHWLYCHNIAKKEVENYKKCHSAIEDYLYIHPTIKYSEFKKKQYIILKIKYIIL